MTSRSCSVIVFDLDDTLFPEHQFVDSGFRAVDEWLTSTHRVTGFYGVAAELFAGGARGKIFDLALDALRVAHDGGMIAELISVYRKHTPRLELHPDAQWALDYFAGRRRLALLSDGYLEVQRNKVAALGIASRFDALVYSDEFGREYWKPHPRPYLAVMERLSCGADDCVYISDNPTKDFVTARRLGWRTARVCRKEGEYCGVHAPAEYQADVSVNSLYELQHVITVEAPRSHT